MSDQDLFELVPALMICGDEMTGEALLPLVVSRFEAVRVGEGHQTPVEDSDDDFDPELFRRQMVELAELLVLDARARREGQVEIRDLESQDSGHLPTSVTGFIPVTAPELQDD